MYLLCPALVQEFCSLPKLGTPDDGIINQKQALVLNQIMHRDQFHPGNQIPLGLNRGHKRPGPGWGILDKGPGKGNAGAICIADGMGRAGIRYACHNIRLHMISLRQLCPAVIAHLLNTDPFIGGRRITVIDPQEGTDLHVLSGIYQRFCSLRSHHCDLPRSKLPVKGISQIQISKALKGNTVGSFLFANGYGSPAQPVPGRINPFGR